MKLKETQITKTATDEKIKEKEYDFNYSLTDDEFEVEYFLTSNDCDYPEIENIFSKRVYSFIDNEISNSKEILKKWLTLYDKWFFDKEQEKIELVIELDRYYQNEKNLKYISQNSGIFPYLFLFFQPKEKLENITYFNLLGFDELVFNILKNTVKEKNKTKIEIDGKISNSFNIVDFKKKLRDDLNITPEKLLNINFSFIGEATLLEEKLETLKLEIKLETNGYIEKTLILKVEEQE